MSTEALKACPFCGGEAQEQVHYGRGASSHSVWCSDCNCGTAWMVDRDAAISLWNRRSAPAAGTDQNAERYRLLIAGDIIDVDDEFLSSDCTEWEVVPPSARTVFLGCRYNPNMFKPARRKVAAIEARTKAGKETGP